MSGGPTYRVLIVDDSTEDRYIFRRYLHNCAEHEFAVSEADSASAGLARSQALAPDCVLLDYHLPDLNGVDFIHALRDRLDGHAPAVVMLTGQGSETLAVEVMKAGAQDYLVKGLAQERICHAIPRAVATVDLHRRLATQARAVAAISAERERLIGELEKRALAMTETDRRKDEFLATLAHELRNPLAPIRSAMQILATRNGHDPTVAGLRAVVERQVGHLARLVDDLTDVARITSGKVSLRREVVSVASVIAHALEICHPAIERGGHRVAVTGPDAPVLLDADPVHLVQIVANVLGNACKYTLAPGVLYLDVAIAGKEVVFTIADPGIGISPAALERIFDIFTQVRQCDQHGPGGLGIGLSLARRFARLHGGEIRAHSAGLHQGSRFEIRLPVVLQQPAPPAAASAPGAAPAGQPAPATSPDPPDQPDSPDSPDSPEPPHPPDSPEPPEPPPRDATAPPDSTRTASQQVLVVDDNVDATTMLQLLFEIEGYTVHTVFNGAAAVDQVRAAPPDFLVMDLGMPGMDGYATMRALRALPGGERVVAIALSGWNQPDTIQRAHAAGFDHHLVKPVEFARLKDLLRPRPPPA